MSRSDSNTMSTRRSSRVAAPSDSSPRRHRDSVISTLLRQEIERRKSLKEAADGPSATEKLLPMPSAAFELPGIHISRIETMDFDDDELSVGSRRGMFGGIGGRRFIIIESDLSSCDFSQFSFTSEYSLTGNGSRSSRSRSSHASSNVSSRLWDFRGFIDRYHIDGNQYR